MLPEPHGSRETNTLRDLEDLSFDEVRSAIRANAYTGHTAGLAPGNQQCNVVILAQADALDFFRYCQRNPRPCPLIDVSDTGDPLMRRLGRDIDIRTDVPLYNVYRDGRLTEQRPDIRDLWRSDLVVFALGCSFTFEHALIAGGIPMRHIEGDRTVSVCRTSIETTPAGRFSGSLVVSMRPVKASRLETVSNTCARFPHAHGRPVHAGDPEAIGITDINRPDWGDAVEIRAGEVPVFWACGVTPQNALLNAEPELCITHTPGSMLLTELAAEPEDG
jgi:uncharacterized protein YcsI (UPF0317 family)